MNSNNKDSIPTYFPRIFLLISSLILAGLIFFLKGGYSSQSQLDHLSRQSLSPDIALANGKPTIFEFYADWCEVCREMAPYMSSVKAKKEGQIDVVLLNIDNPQWEDLVEKYEVNGIPQLNLFDKNSVPIGVSLGIKNEYELSEIFNSMIQETPLPDLSGISQFSTKTKSLNTQINQFSQNKIISPRSHG